MLPAGALTFKDQIDSLAYVLVGCSAKVANWLRALPGVSAVSKDGNAHLAKPTKEATPEGDAGAPGKKQSLIGCITMEIAFRQTASKDFGAIEGVVGLEVRPDKIIVRVLDEQAKARLPKTYRNRPLEAVVTGPIKKRL